jgi:hypothetical protein
VIPPPGDSGAGIGPVDDDENPFKPGRPPLKFLLDRCAAVAEATVTGVRYQYDEVLGPRRIAQLSDARTHRGQLGVSSFEVNMFGGFRPDGTSVAITHGVPPLEEGSRYLMLLTNRPWYYTPVLSHEDAGDFALRIDAPTGRSILLHNNGRPLMQLTATGLRFHPARIARAAFSRPIGPPDPDNPLLAGAPAVSLGQLALDVPSFLTVLDQQCTFLPAQLNGQFDPAPRAALSVWGRHPTLGGTP